MPGIRFANSGVRFANSGVRFANSGVRFANSGRMGSLFPPTYPFRAAGTGFYKTNPFPAEFVPGCGSRLPRHQFLQNEPIPRHLAMARGWSPRRRGIGFYETNQFR
ncbi:Phenylalanyl-tRNA synthetase beta chain [Fimbriiglobus ruber]|uniref:Phenylalanyl-tRNA synthetase beta chain n=1 Tax=Fimbriiglobus ruber TaxID=1908690 RepID=A0A225D267_9BACT|nr:Phenylalanyl-tRNA synthetase beta chain [Fimbriiglobus ruber]